LTGLAAGEGGGGSGQVKNVGVVGGFLFWRLKRAEKLKF